MTLDARNALPTFEVCVQNCIDSQSDDDLREAFGVGSDYLKIRCAEEHKRRTTETSPEC